MYTVATDFGMFDAIYFRFYSFVSRNIGISIRMRTEKICQPRVPASPRHTFYDFSVAQLRFRPDQHTPCRGKHIPVSLEFIVVVRLRRQLVVSVESNLLFCISYYTYNVSCNYLVLCRVA